MAALSFKIIVSAPLPPVRWAAGTADFASGVSDDIGTAAGAMLIAVNDVLGVTLIALLPALQFMLIC